VSCGVDGGFKCFDEKDGSALFHTQGGAVVESLASRVAAMRWCGEMPPDDPRETEFRRLLLVADEMAVDVARM